MTESLERLKQDILILQRARRGAHRSPHKLLLLLAVLDLAEDGLLGDNRIYPNKHLVSRFEYHFERFGTKGDMCQAAPPFFHLRSSPFWFHRTRPGREAAYGSYATSGGGFGRIVRNVEYAYLAPYAHEVIVNPETRGELRSFLEDLVVNSAVKEMGDS